MTSRSRSLGWMVAAVLATGHARARAQDVPLYRDPSPTEGPRIEGPLLPTRPPSTAAPLPPGGPGPFQLPSPGLDPSAAAGGGPIIEPLLGVPPMPPPLPAMAMPPMGSFGEVEFKRTTKIRGPNGVFGRCHEWFHDALFGPPRPSTTPRRGLFGAFHANPAEANPPARFFNWPSWPSWPLSADR